MKLRPLWLRRRRVARRLAKFSAGPGACPPACLPSRTNRQRGRL